MPQTSEELVQYWGGVDEEPVIQHLEDQGFTLTPRWTWIKPNPDYKLTERDVKAIVFLKEEWDFGGLE